MTRSLTLLDSSILDLRTIDRLLQAVVFFADSIAIRASFEIAPAYRDRGLAISRRIDELHEAGLLKLWSHEYEVDEAGRLRFGAAGAIPGRRADLVIARDRLRSSLTEMDEVMRAIREEAYRRGKEGAAAPLRQGTAEIVGLRNHLASLVISSELDQDGLLTNPAARADLLQHLQTPIPERFEAAVVKDVVAKLELGSLTQLSVDQIIQSRQHNADFRTLLDESLLAVARGLDPVVTPEATAQQLVDRYRATVAEFARPQGGGVLVEDVVWDLLGTAVPPTMVFKYGLRALNWRKTRNRVRPFLLLMHLERSLRGQRSRGRA
jgi:hypothetical protein